MPLNLVQNFADKKLFLVSILHVLKENLPLVVMRSFLRKCLRLKMFFTFFYLQESAFESLLGAKKLCFRLIKHYVKLDFYHAKLNLAIYIILSTPYANILFLFGFFFF
jgi:hypothetical protein